MLDVKNQIWKSSDQDLLRDQRSYQDAINQNRMPEMMDLWKEALEVIDQEIELRGDHARAVGQWRIPVVLDEAPF